MCVEDKVSLCYGSHQACTDTEKTKAHEQRQHFITPSHKYNRLLAHNRDRHTYTGTADRVTLTQPCSLAQATGLGPSRQSTTLSGSL